VTILFVFKDKYSRPWTFLSDAESAWKSLVLAVKSQDGVQMASIDDANHYLRSEVLVSL
jgi:hypothetical protein